MATKTTKTTRTNWKQLYLDLPENVAARLREKRVKPEQLTAKTDGEILALGLSDVDLETIRAKYPIVLPDAAAGAHHDARGRDFESFGWAGRARTIGTACNDIIYGRRFKKIYSP